jgi:ribulose-phosphate 3-epimerase
MPVEFRGHKILLAPSILSADFARLGEQVGEAVGAGADYIHVDVMDGCFVPNITIGAPVVAAIRESTTLPLDVHLMIEAPDRHLAAFARAGADIITVHTEVCPHLHRTLQFLGELKVRKGVAINPATPVAAIEEVLPEVDLVLVMSVNPGFGGQTFIPSALHKISRVRRMLDESGLAAELAVDGGVTAELAPRVAAAGARVLVAGSAVFNSRESVAAAMERLRRGLSA